jgi:glyoxylate utilization-related uncharacterized protein
MSDVDLSTADKSEKKKANEGPESSPDPISEIDGNLGITVEGEKKKKKTKGFEALDPASEAPFKNENKKKRKSRRRRAPTRLASAKPDVPTVD